ncbi:MAG: hypothetical protein QNK04_30540 [Myxococcota bacterium]|nr:hypothetical protein [Myxococcota bacterium]
MMGKTFASIAIALTLLALPAGAHHRGHGERDRKIVALAEELEVSAHQLYCDAVESTRRARWSERYALKSLRHLDRQAGDFVKQVERRGVHHRSTTRALHELRVAVHRAERRLWAIDGKRKVRRGFERVEKLTEKLDRRVARARDQRRDRIARHEDRRQRASRNDDRRDGFVVWSGPFNDWEWGFAYRY